MHMRQGRTTNQVNNNHRPSTTNSNAPKVFDQTPLAVAQAAVRPKGKLSGRCTCLVVVPWLQQTNKINHKTHTEPHQYSTVQMQGVK